MLQTTTVLNYEQAIANISNIYPLYDISSIFPKRSLDDRGTGYPQVFLLLYKSIRTARVKIVNRKKTKNMETSFRKYIYFEKINIYIYLNDRYHQHQNDTAYSLLSLLFYFLRPPSNLKFKFQINRIIFLASAQSELQETHFSRECVKTIAKTMETR